MPDWKTAVRQRLAGANLDGAREAEIVEELSQHLEDRLRDATAAGVDPEEARRAALEELEGDIAALLRDARQPAAREPAAVGSGAAGVLAGAMDDLRMAGRMIRLRPAFSLAIVAMLAVGVAANTAIFSVFNGLFLRPLLFSEDRSLVDLDETAPKWNLRHVGISSRDYHAWSAGNSTFDGMAFYAGKSGALADGSGAASAVELAQVTYNFLQVLGLKPALGRGFSPEEDRPGGAKVMMLAFAYWRGRYGGDRNVVGRVVKINGEPTAIIGVLPREAALPDRVNAWVPLALDPNQGDAYYLRGIGRLRKGVTLAQAGADLMRVHKGMNRAENQITSPILELLRDRYLGGFRTATLILLGAVAVVLLIVCVNVAALTMVRGEARSREIAIRAAMGAPRGRIARQLFTESLILAVSGGALGVLLGRPGLDGLILLLPRDLPGWVSLDWDAGFAVFAIGVTASTALLFGLVPALQAAGADARGCLREARTTQSRGRRGVLGALVVCEVALALVLLVTSGLLLQTFRKVLSVEPGFQPENVATFRIELPPARYARPEQQFALFRDLVDGLRSLPGVTAASAVTYTPLAGHSGTFFTAEGAPPRGLDEKDPVVLDLVSWPGYVRAMGMKLIAGREIEDRDQLPGAPKAAVVNETFARTFWPGGDPLGKRFRLKGAKVEEKNWFRVVGVLRDYRHYGLDEDVRPTALTPYSTRQRPSMMLVVRSPAGGVLNAARESVRRLDPELALFDATTMSETLDHSLAVRRASALMLAAFALVATALALAGIYGVVSFAVTQRAREIGIRLALGAAPRTVMMGVLGGGMKLVAGGIAAGLALCLIAAGALKSMLFGVGAHDGFTYAAVTALVTAVGAAANWIPARRAARTDPNSVLRSE